MQKLRRCFLGALLDMSRQERSSCTMVTVTHRFLLGFMALGRGLGAVVSDRRLRRLAMWPVLLTLAAAIAAGLAAWRFGAEVVRRSAAATPSPSDSARCSARNARLPA